MFVRKPTLLHCITGQLALQCLCSARDAFVVACVTVFIGLVLRGTRFHKLTHRVDCASSSCEALTRDPAAVLALPY